MLVPTPEVSHLHFVVILAFTVVYGVFFLTTTIMFFVYARRDQRLCKRSVWLTGIGGLANTLTSVVYMASFAYVRAWPCWLDFVVGYLGLVPVILTIVCRTIRLVLISWHQESLLKRHLDNSKVKQSWLVGPSQAIIERRLIIALVIILFVDMVFVIVTLLTDEYNGDPNVKSVAFKPAISYFCAPAIEFYPFYAFLGVSLFVFCPGLLYFLPKLQDAFGIRTALMCSMIVGIPSYIIYFIWNALHMDRYDEYWSSVMWPVVGCLALHITSVVMPLWQLRHDCIRDARIRHFPDAEEFDRILSNPVLFAKFCIHCAEEFTAENTRFVEDYQLLKFMAIESFKDHSPSPIPESTMSSDHLTPESTVRPNHLIPSPNPSEVSFARSNNTSPTIYTIPPPSVSISQSIIDFLPGVVKEGNMSLEVPETLQPAFFSFYSTFIKLGGMLEANLPSDVATRARDQIEAGTYSLDMFEAAKKEILEMLLFNAFPRYIDQMEEKKSTSSSRRSLGLRYKGSDALFTGNHV